MTRPDQCFHLFMENISVAFLIQYLTASYTANMLLFVSKCFEPETSLFPTPLTSSLGFTFSQSGISSCTLPPHTHSVDPKLHPVSGKEWGWGLGKTQCKSSKNNFYPLVASRSHEIQGTWAASKSSVSIWGRSAPMHHFVLYSIQACQSQAHIHILTTPRAQHHRFPSWSGYFVVLLCSLEWSSFCTTMSLVGQANKLCSS